LRKLKIQISGIDLSELVFKDWLMPSFRWDSHLIAKKPENLIPKYLKPYITAALEESCKLAAKDGAYEPIKVLLLPSEGIAV
jgi:hypothetical protein